MDARLFVGGRDRGAAVPWRGAFMPGTLPRRALVPSAHAVAKPNATAKAGMGQSTR
jgi:hypothetical protein